MVEWYAMNQIDVNMSAESMRGGMSSVAGG